MRSFIILTIFWLNSVNPAQSNTQVDPLQSTINYRLSKDVFPENYDLEITPYFEDELGKNAFTFDGLVLITLRTEKPGSLLILLISKCFDRKNKI